MATQTLTLTVPDALYEHFKRRAEQSQRSIETEFLEIVASALPLSDKLPDELEQLLDSMQLLDDAIL